MVHWPGILKLDGDDELIYIADHDAFLCECNEMILQERDRLIDCEGNTYIIDIKNEKQQLQLCKTRLSVSQVTSLIQEHEFANAQVCIIKIQFTSIEQAIKAVAN